MAVERHHVAIQMEKENQEKLDNGPIVKTADQLWKYSGETEDFSIEYKNLIAESKENLKGRRWNRSSRKDYFKKYWLDNKRKYKKS